MRGEVELQRRHRHQTVAQRMEVGALLALDRLGARPEEAAYVGWDLEGGTMAVQRWSRARGVGETTRSYP